ncbi:fructose-bisphosphate aldolase protein [Colletotrichum tofieldiae]|uniref:Fructose-bisphosphate aldolase n=1 Tax=Colletotrichum tofieldiae TaxID=708197 RepID=A0A166R769_9PEZI|nr:fructose-bisphosphate aldolase protein [Colletotrichum tofieldiae]GKT75028.1 fructose-bisphosphate aldolase protein [Colletotrichum tofieldiae]
MSVPVHWRDNNRTIQILRKAEKERYGVIAAIAYNLEQIHGLVTAAVEARSPLIIQFFPWAVTFADGLLVRAAKDAVSRASVPISIHLDHAQDEKIIQHAADNLPFDSIMVDMSHYEKKENLEKTAKWVRYCHERGIATEAEPGRIEGAEDGVMDTAGLEANKTTPEEIAEFIATGVDSLAPAFGNVHGEYGEQGPQLDFERLEKIRLQISGRVRLALHGTNGFPPDLMKQCIAAGATKINVNKLVLDGYYTHLKSQVTQLPHTQLIEEGTSEVIRQTKEWMEICGSAGKALSGSLLDAW